MRERMTQDRAETIAIDGLAFLAGLPEQIDRFLSLSGIDVSTLRTGAGNPDVLRAVLDFLLTDDTLVTGYCAEHELEPRDLHMAHRILAGS